MEEEDAAKKAARKAELKKQKQQRIKESGGKRPRPEKAAQPPKPKKSKSKKRKDAHKNEGHHKFGRVMEHVPCPNKSRMSTLSIAIPGSIVSNAQTQELRTHLVGQIARAAAIYHVDEIVVFNDRLGKEIKPRFNYRKRDNDRDRDGDDKDDDKKGNNDEKGTRLQPSTDPHAFMARILQYCECPQYLRRHFFPMHPDLQFAGLLAPLDAPHHVRALDRSEFREGVVTEKKGKGDNPGSLVNCGIRNQLVE